MGETKGQHGGKRPGAGKKTRYEVAMVQKTIRLPPAWIDQLVAEFGSFQNAIETLASRHLFG